MNCSSFYDNWSKIQFCIVYCYVLHPFFNAKFKVSLVWNNSMNFSAFPLNGDDQSNNGSWILNRVSQRHTILNENRSKCLLFKVEEEDVVSESEYWLNITEKKRKRSYSIPRTRLLNDELQSLKAGKIETLECHDQTNLRNLNQKKTPGPVSFPSFNEL